jgi:hypothetical protein
MSRLFIITAFLLSACTTSTSGDDGGGGGGVTESTALVSLTYGEITDLCQYLVTVAGPVRFVDCGDGITTTVGGGTVSQCVAGILATPLSCTATVGIAERCSEDLADASDAEVCSEVLPSSCRTWFSAGCR